MKTRTLILCSTLVLSGTWLFQGCSTDNISEDADDQVSESESESVTTITENLDSAANYPTPFTLYVPMRPANVDYVGTTNLFPIGGLPATTFNCTAAFNGSVDWANVCRYEEVARTNSARLIGNVATNQRGLVYSSPDNVPGHEQNWFMYNIPYSASNLTAWSTIVANWQSIGIRFAGWVLPSGMTGSFSIYTSSTYPTAPPSGTTPIAFVIAADPICGSCCVQDNLGQKVTNARNTAIPAGQPSACMPSSAGQLFSAATSDSGLVSIQSANLTSVAAPLAWSGSVPTPQGI